MPKELLQPEEKSALKGLYTTPDVVLAVFPSVGQLETEHQKAFLKRLSQWQSQMERDLTTLLRVPCRFQLVQQAFLRKDQLWRGQEVVFLALDEQARLQPILFALPRVFAASLCERLFGAPMSRVPDRALMPSETSLLEEMVTEWLAPLSQVFGLSRLNLIAEATTESDPSQSWLRVECPVQCGTVEGSFYLALSVDTVRQLLGETYFQSAPSASIDEICERIGDVPVELHAVLGQVEFSLDALASLRLGDVLTLDRHADDLVEIQLDNTTLFRARAGLAGQSVVLEIISGPKETEKE